MQNGGGFSRTVRSIPYILASDYDYLTQGTVLLTANAVFLSNSSVGNRWSNVPGHSPPEIVSYASVFASLGCIILGLLLDRQSSIRDRKFEDVRSILII